MFKNKLVFLYLAFVFLLHPLLSDAQTLKPGMSGREVASLQRYLSSAGYFSKDKITGYFGPTTARSVWYFQKANGIIATGEVDQKTTNKIIDLLRLAAVSLQAQNSLNLSTTTASIISSSTPIYVASTTVYKYQIQDRPQYDLKKLAKLIQDLVNDKRAEFGLSTISWDEELVDVALDHSIDQAKDNVPLTNPDLICHYPIIRHEGFTYLGYSLGDRLASRNIHYRYAGENIAMIPLSKNLLYLNPVGQPLQVCDDVAKFDPEPGVEEERTALYRQIIGKSLDAVKKAKPVLWANREWRSYEELAKITVDGWMNSPGHRENILRPQYTTAAIGITSVNNYIIITHDFLGY